MPWGGPWPAPAFAAEGSHRAEAVLATYSLEEATALWNTDLQGGHVSAAHPGQRLPCCSTSCLWSFLATSTELMHCCRSASRRQQCCGERPLCSFSQPCRLCDTRQHCAQAVAVCSDVQRCGPAAVSRVCLRFKSWIATLADVPQAILEACLSQLWQ